MDFAYTVASNYATEQALQAVNLNSLGMCAIWTGLGLLSGKMFV